MAPDLRSFRVAVVTDELASPGGWVLPVLQQLDWGVLLLPAAWYPDEVSAPLLTQVAEQVHEFSAHGYALIVIGAHPALEGACAALGVAVPTTVAAGDPDELRAALATRSAQRPSATDAAASARSDRRVDVRERCSTPRSVTADPRA